MILRNWLKFEPVQAELRFTPLNRLATVPAHFAMKQWPQQLIATFFRHESIFDASHHG